MQRPSGVHHLAFMAADIKKHIEFFSQVMGCPLVALFDMHGVDGGLHAFLRMGEHSYFSIVQMAGVGEIPAQIGVTHAGRGELPSAAGTLQHLAFRADDEAHLLTLRDRIRSHGVPVVGPIHHGFCKSIYFAGPDHETLEVATPLERVDPDRWIDPATLAKAGIAPDEAARYRDPDDYAGASPVPQPAFDPGKPHLHYPEDVYARMLQTPDRVFEGMPAYQPPVALPTA